MPGNRSDYRVSRKTPIGEGGCAIVYRATHKPTGAVVALKEALNDDYARRRMRREIEIQSSLSNPHIMPILDYAADFRWFTMPRAEGDLRCFREQLNEDQRRAVIDQAAQGLEEAHRVGHIHRDVTPANILLLKEGDGADRARWVVADWGLVRQVHGHTTALLTTETRFIGTQGYAAPEMWSDPHGADLRADVYSLGRVAAWMVTGQMPIATQPLLPEGSWRSLVREATELSVRLRMANMSALRTLLSEMGAAPENSGPSAVELSRRAKSGDRQASIELAILGVNEPDNQALYLDHLVHLQPHVVIGTRRDLLASLISPMLSHLKGSWRGHDFNYASIPLRWLLSLAQAAERSNDLGLLEDAARALFKSEAHWQRYDQHRVTRDWLLNLRGPYAQTVARALRHTPEAARWYLDEGWNPPLAEPVIRNSLESAGATRATSS